MNERLPLLPGLFATKSFTEKEFYEASLKAVSRRKGLIHGHFMKGRRVCAVGAVVSDTKVGRSVSREYIKALQEANDSVPEATPAERREIVIEWLKKKLSEQTV